MVSLRLAAPLVLETYRATLLVVKLAKRNISDHTTLLRALFCSHPSFLLPTVLRVTVKQNGRLSCLAGRTQSTLRHMTVSNTALYITRTLMSPSRHPFPPTLPECKPHYSNRNKPIRNVKIPSRTHICSITPYVSACRHFCQARKIEGVGALLCDLQPGKRPSFVRL